MEKQRLLGMGGQFVMALCLMQGAATGADSDGLTRLAEGVYAHLVEPDGSAAANTGAIILEHGVLVFDTHLTPEAGEALRRHIAAVTPKPVLFVVNSHFHADHTHGNQAFDAAPYGISSAATRRDVLQRDFPAFQRTLTVARDQIERMQKSLAGTLQDPAQRDALKAQITARQDLLGRMTRLKIVAPTIAFEDSIRIVDRGREIILRAVEPAHTDGDILLHLPAEKIVFAGDLFVHRGLPYAQDASLLSWTKALKELLQLDAEQFVPGHGAVGTKADIEEFLAYLEELRKLVEPAVARGDSLEAIVAEVRIPAKYAGYRFQDFFVPNLQKMYIELKAARLKSNPPRPGDGKRTGSDAKLPL